MIICNKCFSDPEIKSRIKSHNRIGRCSVCHEDQTYIYDTEIDTYLNGIFDKIINIYTPISSVSAIDASKQTFLKDEFIKKWKIFNNISDEQIYLILKELSKDLYNENSELFDKPIINLQINNIDYLKENAILKDNNWENFVEALKHENRFHTNHMNKKILEVFCSYIRKTYKKGQQFFRCRISNEEGFTRDNMGAPPAEKATDGRVNSAGISRLYLADDTETAIREIRAGALDYVTIGRFELKEDITVVDLKMINQISPFIEELDAMQYFINKDHLNKIDAEMGKALRRNDSPLDYVPTQYISDFIQSITYNGKHEYAGIEYKSTLHPSGYNVAIFNPSLFECTSVDTLKIKELVYVR